MEELEFFHGGCRPVKWMHQVVGGICCDLTSIENSAIGELTPGHKTLKSNPTSMMVSGDFDVTEVQN